MITMDANPPTKKRKVSKAEGSVCEKKELKSSFCRFGDDRKKVFDGASEVNLHGKKGSKNVKAWSDLKKGTRGMLQTCHSYVKKVKEDMTKARYAPHHVQFKRKPKYSSYRCSSLLKTSNLRDLLPSSKFHSVRKRTPFSCKIEHIRTDIGLNSPNGHDLESKVAAAANITYLAVPISMGGAQSGTFPLVSQNLEIAAAKSELFPVCGVKRKYLDEGTHNLDFKGSKLGGGGPEVRRKISKAYVRNKYREPFFKHEKPDNFYALHLLADTALRLASGELKEGHNEHEPLCTNSKSHASKVNAERHGGEEPRLEAASVIQKELLSDDVSLNVHVLPEVNHLICTTIDEKQVLNQDLKKMEKELESQEVTNADRMTDGAENECIDCHSSMCTQPHTLEGFQTKESIDNIHTKERNQLKNKVSSACCELEPCSTYHQNSQPRLLTCMPQNSKEYPSSSSTKSSFDISLEDSPKSKECRSSFNTTKFRNQSPGYRVREIVHSSKLKATRMVDVATKVMSSMKVGEDAYAMVGEALDSGEIWNVGVHSRISRLQPYSYQQNGGPGNFHQDLSCNPAEVASMAHSINSTVPAFSQNDFQIPPKLISACVAALLMIQACSDTGLPPAEAMEILEHAARDLHPQYSQNLHIYREIEELMSIIKAQVLSLVRTPGSNLHL